MRLPRWSRSRCGPSCLLPLRPRDGSWGPWKSSYGWALSELQLTAWVGTCGFASSGVGAELAVRSREIALSINRHGNRASNN
jgi:hypothetical protein